MRNKLQIIGYKILVLGIKSGSSLTGRQKITIPFQLKKSILKKVCTREIFFWKEGKQTLFLISNNSNELFRLIEKEKVGEIISQERCIPLNALERIGIISPEGKIVSMSRIGARKNDEYGIAIN